MTFRSHSQIKTAFLHSRSTQSERDFIRECCLSKDIEAAGFAIREAIANLGGVEPGFVHANDTFQTDLVHFDFWGSLDSIAVVLELEKALGRKISDKEAEQIPNPELIDGLTVTDFVLAVLAAVRIAPTNVKVG